MSYSPVEFIATNYRDFGTWFLKFYLPSTTTPISMATDASAATKIAKAEVDSMGFFTTDGTTRFIPFIDRAYDAYIFPTAEEADNNDTVNAIRVADNISVFGDELAVTPKRLTVVPGQTVYTDIGSEVIIHVDGRMLHQTNGDYSLTADGDLVLADPFLEGQNVELWSRTIVPDSGNGANAGLLTFETVQLALESGDLKLGMLIHIKETVTSDPNLTFWEVVETATIAPNKWNQQVSTFNSILSIKLQGSDDWIFNLSRGSMELIAHRGSAYEPENTVLAVSAYIQRGCTSVEIDVQPSADGTMWCYHDPNLDTDTNLSGTVNSTADATLELATLNSANGTVLDGIGLSKLEDILIYCSQRTLKIYPEMKFSGWSEANIKGLLTLLEKYNYLNDRCMIQAVDTSLLQTLRETNKDVLIAAALNTDFATAKPSIDLMQELGNGALVWDQDALLNEQDDFFPYCFSRGVRIVAFTITDVDKAERLKALGCNGIITDTFLGARL